MTVTVTVAVTVTVTVTVTATATAAVVAAVAAVWGDTELGLHPRCTESPKQLHPRKCWVMRSDCTVWTAASFRTVIVHPPNA